MNIQWYPGHMTKARRMIEEKLPVVDIVMEVVDARAPQASRNPAFDDLFAGKERVVILNKADLAEKEATRAWMAWYRERGWYAMEAVATQSRTRKEVMAFVERAMRPRLQAVLEKKGVRKVTRAMMVGIPNVGKSALINCLAGGGSAKVGNQPGVTRGAQLIRITPYLELLDTPGILWPRFDDQGLARHLAYTGAVKDQVVDTEELACLFLEEVEARWPEAVSRRYGVPASDPGPQRGYRTLEAIARKRGILAGGGLPDCERAAAMVLTEYRAGKLGPMTWECAGEYDGR